MLKATSELLRLMSEMLAIAAVEHLCSGVVTNSLSHVLQVNLLFFIYLLYKCIFIYLFIVRLIALVFLLANSSLIILYIYLEEL